MGFGGAQFKNVVHDRIVEDKRGSNRVGKRDCLTLVNVARERREKTLAMEEMEETN